MTRRSHGKLLVAFSNHRLSTGHERGFLGVIALPKFFVELKFREEVFSRLNRFLLICGLRAPLNKLSIMAIPCRLKMASRLFLLSIAMNSSVSRKTIQSAYESGPPTGRARY
jgi:hypothetical protein